MNRTYYCRYTLLIKPLLYYKSCENPVSGTTSQVILIKYCKSCVTPPLTCRKVQGSYGINHYRSIKQYNVKDHSFVAIGIVAACVAVSLITIQMAMNS